MHYPVNFPQVEKPWGWQRPVLRNEPLHVDEIEVSPGGYCSVHRHTKKVNLFHVLKGKLAIFVFSEDGAIIRTEPMEAGEWCIIEAGEWHQFWSQKGCLAQEVYYGTEEQIQVIHGDIDRKKEHAVGGIAPMLHGLPSMAGIYLQEAGS